MFLLEHAHCAGQPHSTCSCNLGRSGRQQVSRRAPLHQQAAASAEGQSPDGPRRPTRGGANGKLGTDVVSAPIQAGSKTRSGTDKRQNGAHNSGAVLRTKGEQVGSQAMSAARAKSAVRHAPSNHKQVSSRPAAAPRASSSPKPRGDGVRREIRATASVSAGVLAAPDALKGSSVLDFGHGLLESQAGQIGSNAAYRAFNERVAVGELEAGLRLVQALATAGRADALKKLQHASFLRAAHANARRGNGQLAVNQVVSFLRLVPQAAAGTKACQLAASVCAAAHDPAAVLEIAELHRQCTGSLGVDLAGGLITSCMAAGSLEKAAELYDSVASTPSAHRQSHMAHAAMICACGRAIQSLSPKDRRGRLVLLQRALRVADDIRAAGGEPSLEVLQALAVAAGHAGQVQQALQICREMQAQGYVDERMYTILVHAAATAGKREMALKSYKRGKDSGATGCVALYTAAIGACATPDEPADVETALDIYHDMRQANVAPDARLYSVMVRVAGLAGRYDVAMEMQDSMAASVLTPTRETQSALVSACVACGELDRALLLVTGGQLSFNSLPLLPAFNALLSGLARDSRLDDIITTLTALHEAHLRPDSYSYAAVLSCLQRCQAHDLAFSVYRLMRKHNVAVDETICFVALRICFNALRGTWRPGGYPPSPDAQGSKLGVCDTTAARLMHVLDPSLAENLHMAALSAAHVSAENGEQDDQQGRWASLALGVYRDALAGGCKPRMHVLERVLACLRLPVPVEEEKEVPNAEFGDQPGLFLIKGLWPIHSVPEQRSKVVQWPFDQRALAVVEGAIAQGLLSAPGYSEVDLRGMSPNLAQAYLLTSLAVMQRSLTVRRHVTSQDVVVLVPPYDPTEVWQPSVFARFESADLADDGDDLMLDVEVYREDDELAAASKDDADLLNVDSSEAEAALAPAWYTEPEATPSVSAPFNLDSETASESTFPTGSFTPTASAAAVSACAEADAQRFPGHCPLDNRTGLGVAGMLRRITLQGQANANTGRIVIKGEEVGRWLRYAFGAGEPTALPNSFQPGMHTAAMRRDKQQSIVQQQRNIRLGIHQMAQSVV